MFDDEFDYISPDYDDEYEEPETWTLISALDRVLNEAIGSNLSKKFWNDCKNPLAYLMTELNMTRMQVVVLAMLVEKKSAKCLNQGSIQGLAIMPLRILKSLKAMTRPYIG